MTFRQGRMTARGSLASLPATSLLCAEGIGNEESSPPGEDVQSRTLFQIEA